ncbi:hypothetical protein GCM10022422_14520 [Flavobacterium ginsengisoli]|uniref:Uncharacterized protein n=1 Tax=Flavobacterium ginsengisoli TaxID=871694 RepID=A0ABP7F8E8_9FLAO|nr:hypothetical protein [Flavobacterium ginsengisoli]
MSDSKLISFFNETNRLTDFEVRRKIYDLTNNLDIDLLSDLIDEYRRYTVSLVQKIKLDKGIDVPDIFITSHLNGERKTDIIQRRNKYIDTHLKNNKQTDIDEVEIESKKNLEIVYDLVRRKISDLPKNARQRNNDKFDFYFSDIEEGDFDWYSHNGNEAEFSEVIVDLSDTTSTGKIVFLEKLGIIDFLRAKQPFNTSVNSMATVLSAITGTKASTIQSMINPMLRDDVSGKNNPMNSKKGVDTVEIKLAKIGFNFKQ